MVTITQKIRERINVMDNQFSNLADDELEKLITYGQQLVKQNGGVWEGMIKTHFTEQDYASLSAAALYKMATAEENYQ